MPLEFTVTGAWGLAVTLIHCKVYSRLLPLGIVKPHGDRHVSHGLIFRELAPFLAVQSDMLYTHKQSSVRASVLDRCLEQLTSVPGTVESG